MSKLIQFKPIYLPSCFLEQGRDVYKGVYVRESWLPAWLPVYVTPKCLHSPSINLQQELFLCLYNYK